MNTSSASEIFKSIKNRNDLETLFDIASKNGFYLGSAWDAHNRHLSAIVQRNNPLQLEVPNHINKPTQDISNDYVAFEELVKKHFAQFGVEKAIEERMQNIFVDSVYSSYPRKKTYAEVVAMGYTPHPEIKSDYAWYAYDLSKPLKIRYRADQNHFNRLLALIGGPELPYYSAYSFPETPETDEYIIHSNRKIQFKNLELATRLRDLMVKKKMGQSNSLIKL